jgi:hypothetical protein
MGLSLELSIATYSFELVFRVYIYTLVGAFTRPSCLWDALGGAAPLLGV